MIHWLILLYLNVIMSFTADKAYMMENSNKWLIDWLIDIALPECSHGFHCWQSIHNGKFHFCRMTSHLWHGFPTIQTPPTSVHHIGETSGNGYIVVKIHIHLGFHPTRIVRNLEWRNHMWMYYESSMLLLQLGLWELYDIVWRNLNLSRNRIYLRVIRYNWMQVQGFKYKRYSDNFHMA